MKDLVKNTLIALGFTQAQIDDMNSDEPKGVQAELVAHAIENQKKLLKNDADFVGEIKSAEKGRLMSLNEQVIKKTFGLTAEETKDKTFAEIVALGQQKAMKTSGATTEQLQLELVAATTKLKEFEEVHIPKIRSEVENEKKRVNIDFKLSELVNGFEFSVAKPAAHSAFKSFVDSKFDLDQDDKGEVIVKVKGTDLAPKSKDGTKLLGLKDIASETFEEWAFLKKSNAPPEPPKPGTPIVAKEGEKSYATNSSVSKAEENLKKNMPQKQA